MRCRPLDKNHRIGDRYGEYGRPICDAACDCVAVECKTSLGMDEDTVNKLAGCLKVLQCGERHVAICFERMRMPGRYMVEYYRRKLQADVDIDPSDICQSAGCFQ